LSDGQLSLLFSFIAYKLDEMLKTRKSWRRPKYWYREFRD